MSATSWFSTFGILLQIALRNLVASRYKTLIVGGIVGFGAFLVVLGTSLVDSVDASMSRSIIGSVTGHLQVYSSKSKGDLDVMGGLGGDSEQPTPLDDFAKVRSTLLSVPNVEDVVPMGIDGALVLSGNTIDRALARLREAVNARSRGPGGTATEYEVAKGHVRQILKVLGADVENLRKVQDDGSLDADDLALVQRATSDEYWTEFERDPLTELELLENRVAPMAADADMLFLRYVGTDPAAFAHSFDRLRIVDGTAIPQGERGFLFSKYMYEEQVKLKTARRLDKIQEARKLKSKSIAGDPELERLARDASKQVRELLMQLDTAKTELFTRKLQAFLPSQEPSLEALLRAFLTFDDSNFEQRFDFFYKELAPSLELYRVRVGDTLTIKAFTRSGYVQSANLRVYGTYAFEGLEQSPQAGSLNLMDLVSFRELYGFMTADRQREIAAMQASSGAREIPRAQAEELLFGAAAPVAVAEVAPPGTPAQVAPSPTARAEGNAAVAVPTDDVTTTLASLTRQKNEPTSQAYDPAQLQNGVILNAAVLLKDSGRLEETRLAIEEAGKRDGLELKAISWQQAAGLVGQFTVLAKIVLYTAVLIIFVVALVIINNALVMATLERVREIGTLRAVGAQRGFVLGMLLLESVATGVIFGALGALGGALVVAWFGKVGIPAANDVFTFFFSGPRLFPFLGGANLVLALLIVLIVSVASSAYPAWLALRVSPVKAMAADD
jgi:ABC-type lipoprotein release transport system permease subunit